jgi:hypothetical protein
MAVPSEDHVKNMFPGKGLGIRGREPCDNMLNRFSWVGHWCLLTGCPADMMVFQVVMSILVGVRHAHLAGSPDMAPT